jgi:hypothetical protein
MKKIHDIVLCVRDSINGMKTEKNRQKKYFFHFVQLDRMNHFQIKSNVHMIAKENENERCFHI